MQRSPINARQIKAARALLDWSQDDLAAASKLSIGTIRKIEGGEISPRDTTMTAIRMALEEARIEFTPSSGLRLQDNNITMLHGQDAFLQLLADVRELAAQGPLEACMLYNDGRTDLPEETFQARELRKMGVTWRFICEEGNTHLHYPINEYRWLPKAYFKRNLQLIYGNKVAMSCSVDKRTNQTTQIAIIESASLADSNKNLFNFMWENCRKPTFTTAPVIYE